MKDLLAKTKLSLITLALVMPTIGLFSGYARAASDLPFSEYLSSVENYSIDYVSQKQNLVAAKAGIDLAGVRPDPILSFGAAKEIIKANQSTTTDARAFSITQTIETAGKRQRRLDLAKSNVALTERTIGGFYRQLTLDALDAFLTDFQAREILKRKQDTYKSLLSVVNANEKRLQAGAIGRLELTQSMLEAQRYGKEVASAQADLLSAQARLSVPLGRSFAEVFGEREPYAALDDLEQLPPLDELMRIADKKRDDIQIARAVIDASRAQLELTKANRWVDVDLSVGVNNTPAVRPIFDNSGNVTNTPDDRSRTLNVGVSVPIPFSRLQRGDLIQASTAVTQAELGLESTKISVRADLESAVAQYNAAVSQLVSYRTRTLPDNQRVLDGFKISYQKGAASLLELLVAQRTADDTYLDYLDVLVAYARAKGQIQIGIGTKPDLESGINSKQ